MPVTSSRPPVCSAPGRWPWQHCLVLILLPFLVHAPELSGRVSSDPYQLFFGLRTPVRNWTEGGLLPGMPGWIDGCAGAIVQALGHLVAWDWTHGLLPWWNPYNGVGMPLAGEYQPAAFFLPFVLLTGLPNGLLYMKLVLQCVAGLSMYGLMRELKMMPRVALAAGLLWAFNGTFAWASDGPSEPLAFLPLALTGLERLYHHRRGGCALLAAGLAWMILSGFPETAFLLGLVALFWAVLRFAQAGQERLRFAAGVCAGGVIALLLSAPQLVAFADYLPHAWVGAHAGLIEDALPSAGWSMFLFPYFNGPIFYGSWDIWWVMGGFCGALLPWLAIFALPGRRERGLRIFLGVFILLVILRQAAVPGITQLIDLLPGVGRTVFYRFCPAMTEAALVILAAFGLDDLMRSGEVSRRRVWLATTGVTLAGGAAILADRSLRAVLMPVKKGPFPTWDYELASVGLAVVLILAAVLLTRSERGRQFLPFLPVAEALCLFCVPLLSVMHPSPENQPLMAALRRTAGENRMVTLGPLPPNVNATERLRSLNHNGIPMPSAWIRRMKRDFGPDVNEVTFNGFFPEAPGGGPFLLPVVRSHPDRLEALGVSAVLVPPGLPVRGQTPAGMTNGPAGGEALHPDGAPLTVTMTGWPALTVRRAYVTIGTYGGQSDGVLEMRLCSDISGCTTGHAALTGVRDNAQLEVTLPDRITVERGGSVQITFRLLDARHDLMIWYRPAGSDRMPAVALDGREEPLSLVYSDQTADLYRLPHPAPYFEGSDGCSVQRMSLTEVRTSCAAPGRLIRRELMMPGWTARVNGTAVLPGKEDDLFQTIPLPAGESEIRFSFTPPGMTAAWLAFAAGVVLFAGCFRGWRAGKA